MRRAADFLFVVVLFLVLLAGLGKAVFMPKDENTYENRYANKFSSLTPESYLSGQFQNDAEAALSDQIPLSQQLKKACNLAVNTAALKALNAVMEKDPDHYFIYDAELLPEDPAASEVLFFRNRLCYAPKDADTLMPAIDRRCTLLNSLFAETPNVSFYAYFIENDSMYNFETDCNSGIGRQVLDSLRLPDAQKGCFSIDSFDDFKESFYETDHHWNARASFDAYSDLAKMLELDSPLSPTGSQTLRQQLSGSKAKAIGAQDLLSESVSVYTFDLPQMTVTSGGSAVNYGNEAAYLNGTATEPLTYGSYYGGDIGEIVFDTGCKGENLLILGDSYDNAILSLLASHYSRTYSVDLRYYSRQTGSPFRLQNYLQKNNIDKVLLIGSVSFWTLDDFAMEG